MTDIAAVILAGGKSSRMGTDKALLSLGKYKMIDYVLYELKEVFKDVFIISNHLKQYSYPGVSIVKDVIPGRGPLSGIHAGLIYAPQSYIFVTGCDMPFISKSLVQYMIDKLKTNHYDVLMPKVGKFTEPLFAIYGKGCIKAIEKNLLSGKLKILDFLPEVHVGYVLGEEIKALVNIEKIFLNVNTPEELEHARNMLIKHRKKL